MELSENTLSIHQITELGRNSLASVCAAYMCTGGSTSSGPVDAWDDSSLTDAQELDREWNSRREAHYNAGYLEGLEQGKAESMEEGFNQGDHRVWAVEPCRVRMTTQGACSLVTCSGSVSTADGNLGSTHASNARRLPSWRGGGA